MNREEHLLVIMAEECNEVGQRISKALRFGLSEVQRNQEENNAQRIVYEFSDLIAVYEMLRDEGVIPDVKEYDLNVKKARVEKYLLHSKNNNRLDP